MAQALSPIFHTNFFDTLKCFFPNKSRQESLDTKHCIIGAFAKSDASAPVNFCAIFVKDSLDFFCLKAVLVSM